MDRLRVTGLGSWPGVDVTQAAQICLGELGNGIDLPHLVELPARGPGADMIGRGAAILVDMPVDLQPSGWRLVPRAGKDLRRAQTMLGDDVDAFAHAADGYAGEIKVQVAGPWTLAASLHLTRLEAALADPGACRDIAASLAQGLAEHIGQLRRYVPGANIVAQLDEPMLPAVLAGQIPTASGLGRLRAVTPADAIPALAEVVRTARAAGAESVVAHCCATDSPIDALAAAGFDAVSLDMSMLSMADWETIARHSESGMRLWAGTVPTTGPPPQASGAAQALWCAWRDVGLPAAAIRDVVVTPSCGLAGAPDSTAARSILRRCHEIATALADLSATDGH